MGRLRHKIGAGLVLFLGILALSSAALLSGPFGGPASGGTVADPGAGTRLQWVVWALLSAGLGAGFWLWLRRAVFLPLERAAASVKEMADGRLHATVPEDAAGEIGELGQCVNEMSANIQEALLHVWEQAGECRRLLDAARGDLSEGSAADVDAALSNIDRGRRTLDALRSFVGGFEFYDIRIDRRTDRIVSSRKRTESGARN